MTAVELHRCIIQLKTQINHRGEERKNLLLGRVRKDETPDEEKSSDILPCKKNL